MGAFSPSPLLTPALEARVMHDDRRPGHARLREGGDPFRGFLYAGLMLTADGPKVIEFNVRLGDPEAQVVLPRLRVELAALLMAAASRRPVPPATASRPAISRTSASCSRRAAIRITCRPGMPIDGLDRAAALDDVLVFHGGTRKAIAIVTAGGRVLTIVGRGADFQAAIDRAYAGVDGGLVRRRARAPRHRPQGARRSIVIRRIAPVVAALGLVAGGHLAAA